MRRVPRGGFVLVVGVIAMIATVSGVIALDVGSQSTTGQQTVYTNQNTSNYLSPPSEEVASEAYETVGMDVASGVNTDAQSLHADHDIRTFEQALESADSPEEQTAIADRHDAAILDRYQQLDQEQSTLFQQYDNNQISSSQLLSRLVNLDTVTEGQVAYRDVVNDYSDPSDAFQQEIHSLQIAINADNRVIETLHDSKRGSSGPQTVYAMSTDDSLVLATIDDGSFYRQATVLSERDLAGENQFSDRWREASSQAPILYPWIYQRQNLQNSGVENLLPFTQVYVVAVEHTHGDIRLYFDGATTNVFHETQRKPLAIQPQTNQVFNSTESHEIRVDLHGNAGPMQVTLQDLDGNLIQDANITVDEQSVGETDTSGQRWVVRPTGSFDVTATTPAGDVVTVSVPSVA